MRRLAIVVLILVAAGIAAGSGAGAGHAAGAGHRRLSAGGGVSIRLPAGWHLVRGRMSEVVDPIPRLAVATFHVRLAHHPCECGMPNVAGFPPAGAFVFVWKYPSLSRRDLRRLPERPSRFHVAATAIKPFQCAGPSDGLAFRVRDRAFQVEIYVGPAATPSVRAQLAAILSSWRVTPGPVALPR